MQPGGLSQAQTARKQNKKQEVKKMKRISVDNGRTFVSPEEALEQFDLDVIAHYMDDEDREQTHLEMAPCTDLEFLTRYLEIAKDDIIIG
jgi:hypothetical protein